MSIFSRLFNRNAAQTMMPEVTVMPEHQEAVKPLKNLRSQMVDPRPQSDPLTYQSKEEFMDALRNGAFNAPTNTGEIVEIPILETSVKIGPLFRDKGVNSFKAYNHQAKLIGRAIYRIERGLKKSGAGWETIGGQKVFVYNLVDNSRPEGVKAYKVFYGQGVNSNGNPYVGWHTLHQVTSKDEYGQMKTVWAYHYSEKYVRQAAYNHNERAGDWKAPIWGSPTLFVFAALLLYGKGITLKTSHEAARYAALVEAERLAYPNRY